MAGKQQELQTAKAKPTESARAEEPSGVFMRLRNEAEDAARKPPNWTPQPGEWLQGEVLGDPRASIRTGKRFVEIRVAVGPVNAKNSSGEVVEVPVGGRTLFWESTTTKDLFDELREGSVMAARYDGEVKTSRGGNPAKKYKWSHQPPEVSTAAESPSAGAAE